MKYMLMFYENAEAFSHRSPGSDEAKSGAYWGSWMAYSKAIGEVTVGGNALLPPATATTVRLNDGQRIVQDGPFADSKEQLGGFMTIDVANLDEALAWAARCPAAAYGAVEVRPVMEMDNME